MAFIKDDLGAYLREQRQNAKLTLRQLAELAEVSNPYLSQIERGLKKPSAEILQSLAKGLRVSAESLYVRAGILEQRDGEQVSVEAAILGDHVLTERQKGVLLEIYETFRTESTRPADASAQGAGSEAAAATETSDRTPSAAAKKAAKKVAKKAAKRTPAKRAPAKRTATKAAPATKATARTSETTPTARTAVRTPRARAGTATTAPARRPAATAQPSTPGAPTASGTTPSTTTPRSES